MSGRYFVMVRHYGTGMGTYTISVSASGGGGIDAVDITNGVGEGNIESAGGFDLYQFEAAANLLYVIDTYDLAGGMDSYMHLMGTDGVTGLARNDDGGLENLASHIEFTPTVSGTYFVKIRHYSGNGTGTYKISVIHALN